MRNDGFWTGILTGAAIGALMMVAMSPGLRRPVMRGAGEMGDRMRGMWNRGAAATEAMVEDVL